jgi:RHS repeat-associated protein
MTRQLFFFDALDNHEEVRTTFIKGQTTESNTARFEYNNPDPAQLTRVSNSHVDYPDIELEYDANGNLIKDEEGRTLSYDLLSRLVEVSEPGSDGSRFYGYDGGDQLSASGSDTEREQQFYRNGTPVNSVGAAQSRTYVSADGVTLAERQEGARPKSLLLAGDYSGSVLREVDGREVSEIAYTAYGYRDAAQPVASRPGYNGEVRDETGWYLLGNGYRAFNPRLMRFHSPDSWSPFGDGGVNAYAYCLGDPVSFTDPTGHSAFGDFLRFFRTTTASPGYEHLPPILTMSKHEGPATLRTVKRKHVLNLKKRAHCMVKTSSLKRKLCKSSSKQKRVELR